MKLLGRSLRYVSCVIGVLLIAACGLVTPSPTATPSPTSTLEPTSIPTPEALGDCFLSFRVTAWQDLNGDGLWDASEPPLEGVEFRLQGPFAQIWGKPYLSDADGELTISTWHPGSCIEQDYTITAVPTESYEPTTPASATFSPATGDSSYEGQFGFRAVTK
jgi:hypothetical protein